ncbi:MAG: hydroxymethylbilane synthase [Deltaproteobacteria bacterium]|nr:hydroxymethylbilane synthase [Deltaproteobacteria bacterium]
MNSQQTVLRLGTRGSALALAQSSQVARQLEAVNEGLRVELVTIVTRGDLHKGDLATGGGKGLFTEELEDGLINGSLDLAVHSLKDLPVHLRPELTVAAFPRRADPRDVLISEGSPSLADLPAGSVVLTGSLRRRSQILTRRPDLRVEPLRGNVDTRLEKWRRGDGDAVVLAASGLLRLGLEGLPAHALDPQEEMLPAPGQGTLALEVLAGGRAEAFCRRLNDPATEDTAKAERIVVDALGGDCTLPLAAYCRQEDGQRLTLDATLAMPNGEEQATGKAEGETPEAVAKECLEALFQDGAREVLARLRP